MKKFKKIWRHLSQFLHKIDSVKIPDNQKDVEINQKMFGSPFFLVIIIFFSSE